MRLSQPQRFASFASAASLNCVLHIGAEMCRIGQEGGLAHPAPFLCLASAWAGCRPSATIPDAAIIDFPCQMADFNTLRARIDKET